MSFAGKRLLHIGAALFQVPALACARRNGCRLIVVDRDAAAPGRVFADRFEPISTTDFESVLALAREERIDGIMTYASDSSTPTVAYVAEQLGLRGNSSEAAHTLRRKDLFRQLQQAHGLPHPDFFATSDPEEAVRRTESLPLPIVVKPADSAGTKGQSVIYSLKEVPAALDYALRFSQCGQAVFETFVKSDMLELDGDVLVKDGRLAFRHYGHNYFLKNPISNVPSGECFPGFFGEAVCCSLDEQFRAIIEALDLQCGCMNFDGLYADGRAYIIDIGMRNGGNYVPDLIKLSTGFDLTEAAIAVALGIDYPCESLYAPAPDPVASYLIGNRFSGTFEGIDYAPEIQPFVVETVPFMEPGDWMEPYTRSDKAAGIAFLRFPDLATCREKIGEIEDLITARVEAKQGASMGSGDGPKAFPELISPFLRRKLDEAEQHGDETVARVISRQYVVCPQQEPIRSEETLKHYEAAEEPEFEGERLFGVERLYRRVMLFEPLYQCIAHCRYCLRQNYEQFHQNKEDIRRVARYIGHAPGHQELREVLVTGGDPLLVPHKVRLFLEELSTHAPQIETVRIATRIPVHQPDRVDSVLLDLLGGSWPFRIEVATQINHAAELFPEVREAFGRIGNVVSVVYNQSVLLAGVNDSLDELVGLCDSLRGMGIENHYLFHCIPMRGVNDFRTPLDTSLALARNLATSGRISGRAKPEFALMTTIGKITLYEGAILEHRNNAYLLQSHYSYSDRLEWNPNWRLPGNAEVDDEGFLRVWYEDRA